MKKKLDKEVLNLTGGLYPAMLIQQKQVIHRDWVLEELNLKNKKIKGLYTWVPKDERGQIFSGEKFNVETEKIEFLDSELQPSDWTYDETRQLMDLLQLVNYNFIVAADRFPDRDIYQIKDRYFSVMKQLTHKRGQTTHPLYNYIYDVDYDRHRDIELEKYLRRTKPINEEERKIQEELKRIEGQIRKQEKEHQSLTKCMKIQDVEDMDDRQVQYIVEMYERNVQIKEELKESIIYLRSRWMNESLPIPNKIQKKLEQQLKELLPQPRLVLNEEFERMHSKLKQMQLAVMSQQRLAQRRESEKKTLEEKLKKLKHDLEAKQNENKLNKK